MATADALRMAENRAKKRDLTIPPPLDPSRREACEADDEQWLRTYLPAVFYNPFTLHQRRIIKDCGQTLSYGTQKCKAAPRGDGKSSIIKYLALKYALCRQVCFPLIVSATEGKSKKTLNSLKSRLASGIQVNKKTKVCRPITPLGEDYPLECS